MINKPKSTSSGILAQKASFYNTIWSYYKSNKRELAWRNTEDPYFILVSEIMLQQTQVVRVIDFYNTFIKHFPTNKSLAHASQKEVLSLWKGLGYNRRAINLKRCAEKIEKEYGGIFPRDYKTLLSLPGIGPSTAGALMNFAYNTYTPFIETNIRSVYIYFFFRNKKDIDDKEIYTLMEKHSKIENPREWFYALYDYGTYLKRTIGNQNNKSKHYTKQTAFKGSNREARSKLLQYLLNKNEVTLTKLLKEFGEDKEQMLANLNAYEKEGVVRISRNKVTLI